MTITSRVRIIGLLVLGVLSLAATSGGQQRPPIADEMAKTYGLDSWGQIEGLRYTFNFTFGTIKFSRTWVWEPKTGRVSYEGKDKEGKPVKATYLRSELSSQPANVKDEIDPAFMNDQYWLIFPFHVVWDTTPKVEDKGKQKLPAGKGSAELVAVTYPSNVGYTPGDTWELFVGPDKRIQELRFHHGGTAKPSLVIASWVDYKKGGPILFSTDHRGTADGKPFRISITDVAVKLTGSDAWVEAK
jgi:hypothetical protein